MFGAYGFDGASMRQVAEAADVPVALVSYHFGSKEGLYRAVFERRVPTVVEQRLAGLAIAMSEAGPRPAARARRQGACVSDVASARA